MNTLNCFIKLGKNKLEKNGTIWCDIQNNLFDYNSFYVNQTKRKAKTRNEHKANIKKLKDSFCIITASNRMWSQNKLG